MNSLDLVEATPGLTYRKLDHWCRMHVFGEDKADLGPGGARRFDDEDARIAKILARVSCAMEQWAGPRSGSTKLYRLIAEQARTTTGALHIEVGNGVTLTVEAESENTP